MEKDSNIPLFHNSYLGEGFVGILIFCKYKSVRALMRNVLLTFHARVTTE